MTETKDAYLQVSDFAKSFNEEILKIKVKKKKKKKKKIERSI